MKASFLSDQGNWDSVLLKKKDSILEGLLTFWEE